jgi:hypothetical protein
VERRVQPDPADVGIRVMQTPFHEPNCNAHAQPFVRSIKEECLNAITRGLPISRLVRTVSRCHV